MSLFFVTHCLTPSLKIQWLSMFLPYFFRCSLYRSLKTKKKVLILPLFFALPPPLKSKASTVLPLSLPLVLVLALLLRAITVKL